MNFAQRCLGYVAKPVLARPLFGTGNDAKRTVPVLARPLFGTSNDARRTMHHVRFASQSWPRILQSRHASTDNTRDETEKVLAQYSDEKAAFYQIVMGGEDDNIHYGIFIGDAAGDASRMKIASRNTNDFVVDMMQVASGGTINTGSKILELGSATGGFAHRIIRRFGCHVTGLNICPEQNASAEDIARTLGIDNNFSTVTSSFDTVWPDEWSESFDAVISIDSVVHSADKPHVMQQIARVLKRGAVFSIVDILSAEGASLEQQETLSRSVAGLHFMRPSEYMSAITSAGLSLSSYVDLSAHLPLSYSAMVHQIDTCRDKLLRAGVSSEYMDAYRRSLEERLALIEAGKYGIAWASFSGKKTSVLTDDNISISAAVCKTL